MLANKILRTRNRLPLLELAVGVADPQASQAIASTPAYPPERNSKTLLLKTLHSWVINQGDIKLALTWQLHVYRLVSQCWKRCAQHQRRVSISLTKAVNPVSLAWWDRPTGVTIMNVMRVINNSLIGSKACSMRWNPYLALSKGPTTCG